MVIRLAGKLLRGSARPMQVVLAAVLGALIGFVPDLSSGAGLLVLWLVVLLVLDASLGLAVGLAAVLHVVALLALPVSFAVGRWLLDGSARPVFAAALDTPVLALLGLEHYAVTGGAAVGLVVGLATGVLLAAAMSGYRRRMASVAAGHERFARVGASLPMRVLLFLLVGGRHGRRSYEELLAARRRNPLRPWGVALVVLAGATVWLAPALVSDTVVGGALRGRLERWNGATVDVREVDLDLGAGRLLVAGLAMADPEALDRNVVAAERLVADVATADLLRGRIALDRLEVSGARQGEPRRTPGERIGPQPEVASPTPDEPTAAGPGRPLEDWIEDARLWKERLARVADWLEGLAGEDAAGEPAGPDDPGFVEGLEREAAERGWAAVTADHLLAGGPTFLVREIVAEGVQASFWRDGPLDVRLENVSTHPGRVAGAPRLAVRSRDGRLDVDVSLGGASAEPGANRLAARLSGVPVSTLSDSFVADGEPLLREGRFDVACDGSWAKGQVGWLDLTLVVTLHGVELGGRRLDGLELPLRVTGRLEDPRVEVGDADLAAVLADAVEDEIGRRLDAERSELEGEARGKLEEALGETLGDEASDPAGAVEGAARKELEERTGGLLGGLLGGKSKDDADEEDGSRSEDDGR